MRPSDRFLLLHAISVLLSLSALTAGENEIPRRNVEEISETQTVKDAPQTVTTAFEESTARRGIRFEAVYISDLFTIAQGGLQRKSGYLDNFDLCASLDMNRLWGWKNATAFLYVLGNHGINPSDYIGDVQTWSNIDAPDTWKIYEAWIEQSFLDDRISFRTGLYDLNSEFDVIETGGLFINSSFGIGPDFSQSGMNGPSIFPTTSLGFRIRANTEKSVYYQAVVLDGVPGHPDYPTGTRIVFQKEDGLLLANEIGFQSDEENPDQPYSKIAAGFWRYTSTFDCIAETDATGRPLEKGGNSGIYLLGEVAIYRNNGDPAKNISIFGRYGIADGDVNQFDAYAGAGIVCTGLLFGRDADQLGLAIGHVCNSGAFKRCMQMQGIQMKKAETVLELSYRAPLSGWLVVQPDIQVIIHPGTDAALKNALVFGLRTEIGF